MPSDTAGGQNPSVRCEEITGLDCDFVATVDDSVPTARGEVATQIISSLTHHLFYKHPQEGLGQQQREMIRKIIAGL